MGADAALALCDRGTPVFPCNPANKHPLVANGFKDATTDKAVVTAWWEQWPDAMIGVPTGAASGVFVLDIDVDEDDGVDGFATLAAMEAAHGPLPATRTQRTPRGGEHRLFSCPGFKVKNSASKLGTGLDIRGDGGYFITAPSVNADGVPYEWTCECAPVAAPPWLLGLLEGPRSGAGLNGSAAAGAVQNGRTSYAAAALAEEYGRVARAPRGQRNDALNRAAFSLGTLVGGGVLERGTVENSLTNAAVASGLVADDGDDAVRLTIKSGLDAGLQQPRAIPESTRWAPDEVRGPRAPETRRDNVAPVRSADDQSMAFSSGRRPGGRPRLDVTFAPSLHGLAVPERQWLVQDLVPWRAVTQLGGDGGTGKSLLALQLMTACASGKPWLGRAVRPCRVFGLFAEDDPEEIHIRQDAINRHFDVEFGDLDGMAWSARSGKDNVLMYFDESGRGKPSDLYHELVEQATDFGARLVVLDTLADCFGGNENYRNQARAFVNLLRGLAQQLDGAVMLIAHPSLSGQASGTGQSGSTAWSNSVRSRLYLTRPKGENVDPDERALESMKSNYAGIGGQIKLRWQGGVFVEKVAPTGVMRVAADSQAERVFLGCLDAVLAQGRTVSDSRNTQTFAPRMFAGMGQACGVKREDLQQAMERLFAKGAIVIGTHGTGQDRHPRRSIVRSTNGAA